MSFKTLKKATDYKLPDARVTGIVLHWSAGKYGVPYDDYHFCVAEDGRVLQNVECPPGVWTSHTWHRNTGNIGIAAMAMYEATSEDYGDDPVTRYQIEAIAALCAKLMRRYGIGIEHVITHAEAAELDGYPGERWDFLFERADIKKKIEWYMKK